ncbi:hypothetical protein DPMN_018805 [Dreissena polymorpha]|uniref:Uncharacterized protein n=1 Tax=Dreissena polymorpha TaxID=45954 RepID=A0A9D4NDW0_DREPO|nr:hypothetical protein DPMN_018805 [Dreissena polymorpha]
MLLDSSWQFHCCNGCMLLRRFNRYGAVCGCVLWLYESSLQLRLGSPMVSKNGINNGIQ